MSVIAVIDIGSNGVRLKICRALSLDNIKTLYKLRAPIRLGKDVFKSKKISAHSLNKLKDALLGFEELFYQYSVDRIVAIATSAVRNADNREVFINTIKNEVGIDIHVISGDLEAQLIHDAVMNKISVPDRGVLNVDIGGGSVEFSYSESSTILRATSFPMGTVRTLVHAKVGKERDFIFSFLSDIKKFLGPILERSLIVTGTGGNFECMAEMRKKILGKKHSRHIRPSEVEELVQLIQPMDMATRIKVLGVRADRADVLLPALFVAQLAFQCTERDKILVPKVGLREGVMINLVNGTKVFAQ